MSHNPVVIVGESWNAVISLLVLNIKKEPLIWIPGSGSNLLPPTDVLDINTSKGRSLLEWLSIKYDLQLGEFQQQASFREFRNRAFHRPQWGIEEGAELDQGQVEELEEMRSSELFGPENAFAPVLTGQYSTRLVEFFDGLEKVLVNLVEAGQIKKISSVKLKGVQDDGESIELTLSSGEKIAASRVIYADRWSELSAIEGLVGEIDSIGADKEVSIKVNEINRKWKPTGVLQVIFEHDEVLEQSPLAQSSESFFVTLHKDSADDFPRRAWGYFFDEGKKSIWTVFLSQREVEDNKEITKKIRRVKQGLNKIWANADYADEGKAFTDHVIRETVRFEESVVFEDSQEFHFPFSSEKLGNKFVAMTEGFGLSSSIDQSMILLSDYIDLGDTKPVEQLEVNPSA